jgi:hypothetical protein
MHFLFSLLRIKGHYMFQALLAHPQEALHRRCLVYCAPVMWVGCTRIGVELVPQARNIPSTFHIAPPEDEQVMLETCRGPYFLINWIKSASRWCNCTDIPWCTFNKTLSLLCKTVVWCDMCALTLIKTCFILMPIRYGRQNNLMKLLGEG